MLSINKMQIRRSQSGFTLVELMISLVLGLLVVLAASSLFISNRQAFATTGSLNRIQENARTAFEILARDIREAGGNPCSPSIVTMLSPAERTTAGWAEWMAGVSGVEGGTNPDRIILHSASTDEVAVTSHLSPGADVLVSANPGFQVGDMAMICNPQASLLFKVTSAAGNALGHDGGAGKNFVKAFQVRQQIVDAHPVAGLDGYCFAPSLTGTPNVNCIERADAPAVVVRPTSVTWEIAQNANGGTSLFRTVNSAQGRQLMRDEIAAGVVDLQLRYKLSNSPTLVDASAVLAGTWGNVTGVEMTLELEPEVGALRGRDLEGTTVGERLTRSASTLVAIRNSEGVMQ